MVTARIAPASQAPGVARPGHRHPGDSGQPTAGTTTTPFTLINSFFDLTPAFYGEFVIVGYALIAAGSKSANTRAARRLTIEATIQL